MEDDVPIIKWVSLMILDAINSKKSEISISIEPAPKLILSGEEVIPSKEITKKIINRLKIMSKLAPMKYHQRTEGEIKLRANGIDYDISSSFLDTRDNQTCTLKIKL